MLNTVTISGRLGRDPDFRNYDGTQQSRFSVAVSRDYKDKATGEPAVDWIPVVAWRGLAQFAGRYLKRGSGVIVHGRIQIDKWMDMDGATRTATYVVANNIYFTGGKVDAPADEVQNMGGEVPF